MYPAMIVNINYTDFSYMHRSQTLVFSCVFTQTYMMGCKSILIKRIIVRMLLKYTYISDMASTTHQHNFDRKFCTRRRVDSNACHNGLVRSHGRNHSFRYKLQWMLVYRYIVRSPFINIYWYYCLWYCNQYFDSMHTANLHLIFVALAK